MGEKMDGSLIEIFESIEKPKYLKPISTKLKGADSNTILLVTITIIKNSAASDLRFKEKLSKKIKWPLGSLGSFALLGFAAFNRQKNLNKEKSIDKTIEEKNKIIQLKNEQNELLLKEIHHRVKNNLQMISSLLYLQSKSISDIDAKDAITIGQQRIESMALLHKNLYQKENLLSIEMKEYITKLATNLHSSYKADSQDINIKIEMSEVNLDVDSAIPIGLILNEILTNAFKHAFEGRNKGEIFISLKEDINGQRHLNVKDNGKGKVESTPGFGSRLINLLVKQIDGELSHTNENGLAYLIQF